MHSPSIIMCIPGTSARDAWIKVIIKESGRKALYLSLISHTCGLRVHLPSRDISARPIAPASARLAEFADSADLFLSYYHVTFTPNRLVFLCPP